MSRKHENAKRYTSTLVDEIIACNGDRGEILSCLCEAVLAGSQSIEVFEYAERKTKSWLNKNGSPA